MEPIKMIEIFSGIGAQAKALSALPIPYEVVATMDVDKDAILSYAAIRHDLKKEMETYSFPSKEQMVQELQSKNVGYDFSKQKHSITTRTNENKIKQYYLADKLSKNLGDVSLCKELPYVDVIFHSSPCQSFSQAGKGEGGDEGSGTTSSLMWESLRLIETSKCKYVLWENVAAVLSGKHKHNFIKYLERLSELGYESAFDLLNSKNYGVPQNRLRIFCVSRKIENYNTNSSNICKCKSSNKQVINVMNEIKAEHPNIKIWEDYDFPQTIPLTTRLKDILEKNVAEKYYISNERVEQILNSEFFKEKIRNRNTTVEDNPVRITNIYGDQFGTGYAGNVWDQNGLSPTLQTAQGGNRQPLIVEEEPFIVASRGRNPDNPSDRTTGAPTEQRLEPNLNGTTNCITSVQKDNYVCEPLVYDDYNSRFSYDQTVINTLTTNCGASAPRNGVKIVEPIVCEERRDEGIRFFKDECVGTLRTIDACGDKRVLEPDVTTIKVRNQATEFAGCTDVAGTLMARDYKGFGNQEMTAVVEQIYEPEIIKEDIIFPVTVRKYSVDIEKLKMVLREHKCYTNKEISEKLNRPLTLVEHWFRQDECFAIPDADIWLDLKSLLNIETDEFDKSITTFEEKDGVYEKSNRCYHIDGIAPTLTVASANEKIIESSDNCIKWRIRKLTPTECWRLMGFSDSDCNKAAEHVSASALYKQAGNSIVTNCLVAIFYSLFFKDSSDAYKDYLIDFNS